MQRKGLGAATGMLAAGARSAGTAATDNAHHRIPDVVASPIVNRKRKSRVLQDNTRLFEFWLPDLDSNQGPAD